jgi:hypothetical protein
MPIRTLWWAFEAFLVGDDEGAAAIMRLTWEGISLRIGIYRQRIYRLYLRGRLYVHGVKYDGVSQRCLQLRCRRQERG